MDAVPFLIGRKGTPGIPHKDYEFLHEMRDFLQWRRRDAVLLAEANVPPDESLQYFGDLGDRLQMMLNFPVNQSRVDERGIHEIELEPYAYRWFRARGQDRNVPRG